MNIVESDSLLKKPTQLTAGAELEISQQRSMAADENLIITLTDEHIKQIEEGAAESIDHFAPTESTLVLQKIGRPTALARVDCTIDPATGDIFAYEADERPAGMGVTDVISQKLTGHSIGEQIIDHFEKVFGTPPVVKRHPSEPENDDEILLRVEQTAETAIRAKGRPVLVRGAPSVLQNCTDLQDVAEKFSVSTISDEGRRQYRIATGHANLLLPTSQLPNGSFVVKTLQGSQAKGVKLHITNADAKKLGNSGGSITKAKIMGMIAAEGALLMEPFVPGVEVKMPGQECGRLIMRVFCAINADTVNVIGGTYVARTGHLVHGASDAIAGLVTVD